MIPRRIEKATRYLGAPQGWRPDEHGECGHLAVRDEVDAGVPTMLSAWEPTPAELALLNAGASVTLRIVGCAHPPVMLWVAPMRDTAGGGDG